MPLMTNDPPRKLSQRIFYRCVQWVTLIFLKILVGYKYFNAEGLGIKGGALICPNHFSHLDPMALGSIAPRRISFLAKQSLWNSKLLGKILDGLDCIPIDRQGAGIAGMKETLKRLKRGETAVVFPEGERSPTGELMPLMTGFVALVKRVKIPIVPVGIHGTFEAWPTGASRPKRGRVRVYIGEPIPYQVVANMSEQEMVDTVARKIAECYDAAKAM